MDLQINFTKQDANQKQANKAPRWKSIKPTKNPQNKSATFYQIAAALAKPDLETDGPMTISSRSLNEEASNRVSPFLDASFQECLLRYSASGRHWSALNLDLDERTAAVNRFIKALETMGYFKQDLLEKILKPNLGADKLKICFYEQPAKSVEINGTAFSPSDLSVLLELIAPIVEKNLGLSECAITAESAMPALAFHQYLMGLCGKKMGSGHVMSVMSQGICANRAVHGIRLLCAHRLRRKSWQRDIGANPRLKYFHACFDTNTKSQKQINLVYWVEYNEDSIPQAADFVNVDTKNHLLVNVHKILCPNALFNIRKSLANKKNTHDDGPQSLVDEILKLYLESISYTSSDV